MLKDHLTSFIPSIPPSSSIISVGLSFLLGILVYLSNNIVIYSIVFAFFKLLEIWGIWVRDSQIKAAIEEARKEVPGEDESHRSLDIIENYYIKRPQVQLAITILFFSFVSHILGLLSKLVQGENTSKLFLTGAYSVMIIVILINEFVYKLWRRKRDAHLHEYYS